MVLTNWAKLATMTDVWLTLMPFLASKIQHGPSRALSRESEVHLWRAAPGGRSLPESHGSSASQTQQRGWWACSWELLCTACRRSPCRRGPGCWAYPSLFPWTTSAQKQTCCFKDGKPLALTFIQQPHNIKYIQYGQIWTKTYLLLGFASRLVDWVLVLLGLPSILLLILFRRLEKADTR